MTVLPTGHPADFRAPAADERTGGRLQSGGRMFDALLLDMESALRQAPRAAVAGSSASAVAHTRVATGAGRPHTQPAGAESASAEAACTANPCEQSPQEATVAATRSAGPSPATAPTVSVPAFKSGAGRDGASLVPTDAAMGIADFPVSSTPLAPGATRIVDPAAIKSPQVAKVAADVTAALPTAQADVGVNVAKAAQASPEAGLVVTLAVSRGKPEDLDAIVRRVAEELARAGHAHYRLVINGVDMTPRISNGESHGNR